MSYKTIKTIALADLSFALLAASIILCFLIYWPGLHGPFVLDDMSNLDYLLKSNISLKEIVSNLISFSGQLGRPVSMLSFSINAVLSQDIFFWKLTNLAIHLVCALLMYKLVQNIIYFANSETEPTKAGFQALAVTLLWLLHPLHVSTVLYTVQRMTQLATLFLLAALLSYLMARKRQLNSLPYVTLQILSWGVFFPLAVFSKESGLLFPLFILLFELFLIQKDKISKKQLFLIFIGMSLIAVALFFYFAESLNASYSGRNFTMRERLLTESRIILSYLGMLIIPVQKNMGFLHDDFLLSKSLFEPSTTLFSILAIAVLSGVAFYFRKKQPLLSVGLLFFFIGHLMESTIFSLELMFEHRNYLPSLGIFLALAATIPFMLQNKNLCRSLSVLFLSLLTFSTWLRADSWSSGTRLYYDLWRYQPGSERLAGVLSEIFIKDGNYTGAREVLKPFNSPGAMMKRLYVDCLDHHSLSNNQLANLSSHAGLIDNFAVMSVTDISILGLENKCNFSNLAYLHWLDNLLSQRISSATNRQIIMMYKAHYLWRLEKKDEAISFLKNTYRVYTKNPTPLFLACEWSIDEKRASANELCPMALDVGSKIAYHYDDLIPKVKNRYINFLENQTN